MKDYKDSVEEYIRRKIFSKTGEAFLDFSLEEDDIYSELNDIGQWLCRKYPEGNSSFYLLDSVRVQAAAIHGHQAVLVCKGMVELIFRTSDMMVGAERRLRNNDEKFYEPWRDNLSSWLKDGDFEWSNNDFWWIHEESHRKMFEMFVEGMFVFIVLHEIGHLHNLHGERRGDKSEGKIPSASDNIVIHEAVSCAEEKNETDSLAVHAREIIADTYAFQFMLTEFEKFYFPASEYENLNKGALCVANYNVCIYIVASLFWALNFQRPMRNDTQEDYYPSHVFRLQSIETASLEHRICGGDYGLTHLAVRLGMQGYTGKLRCATDNDELSSWRTTMDIPANFEHYQKICGITEKWSNMKYGVRDEDYLRDVTTNWRLR